MIPLWFLTESSLHPVSELEADGIRDSTGMECVGRLNKSPGLYQNPNNDRHCEFFSRYLLSKGIIDPYDDYKIARPSFKRELKAVGRYGLAPIDEKPSKEHLEKVLQWLEFEFGPLVEGHRIVEPDEVEIQGSTTPGIPYKWYYKTKREALVSCLPDLRSFWAYAHRVGSNLMWHNFCKVELLPSEKVDADNIRSITGPDIAYHVSFSRMMQDFNQRLAGSPHATVSALGFNKYEGGIQQIADYLNVHPNKEENDATKFDALFPGWARIEVCKEFRWRMMLDKFKTNENWKRLSYYYSQAVMSKIALVTGYVISKLHGLCSGEIATTYDGTIHHAAAFMSSYIRLVSDDYSHFKRNVRPKFYGDDEIFSMSDEVKHLFTFEARAKCYRDFGIRLKPEAHKQSQDLRGMSFLGCSFMTIDTGQWVGRPVSPRKMVASLLKPPKPQKPAESMARAIALTYESYWHPETRDLIWGFVKKLVREGLTPDSNVACDDLGFDMSFAGRVPTLRSIKALWLGHQ